MTHRADRAHVLRHVDVFVFCAILPGMSRRQHQANKSSKRQQSAVNTNGIIPVGRHVAAPMAMPAPKQQAVIPVVAQIATPIAAPKQEQHATPAVIPVVQHQAAHEPSTPAQDKAPTSHRRPKTRARKRNKNTAPTVANTPATPTVAPTAPVHESKQVEQSHVQAVVDAAPIAPVAQLPIVAAADTPSPKRERPARAPRATRGRVKEPLRWAFTYADVAAAAGVSVDRVRHASARIGGREPSLVMTDLRSVARFIEGRRVRAAA